MADLMESSELRGAGFGGKTHGQSNLDDNTYRVPMPEPKSNPMIIDGQEVKPAQMPNIEPKKQLKPSEYPKDHPLNPDYKSPLEKSEAPPATGQQSSNGTAATASAMARELPGEENSKIDTKLNPDRARDENRTWIKNALIALGLTKEQELHAGADLEGQAAGRDGKLAPANIVATAQRVSGDIGNLKPEVLSEITNIGNKMKTDGYSIEKESIKEEPKIQAAYVVPPPANAELTRTALS